MNLEQLLNNNLIERFQSNTSQIRDKITIAERELEASRLNLTLNNPITDDVAYKSAYNAMLSIGYALMFHKGYRPKDRSKHHWIIVEFVKGEYSNNIPSDITLTFENSRQQRNILQYESAGIITNSDARNLLTKAEVFVIEGKRILNIP